MVCRYCGRDLTAASEDKPQGEVKQPLPSVWKQGAKASARKRKAQLAVPSLAADLSHPSFRSISGKRPQYACKTPWLPACNSSLDAIRRSLYTPHP